MFLAISLFWFQMYGLLWVFGLFPHCDAICGRRGISSSPHGHSQQLLLPPSLPCSPWSNKLLLLGPVSFLAHHLLHHLCTYLRFYHFLFPSTPENSNKHHEQQSLGMTQRLQAVVLSDRKPAWKFNISSPQDTHLVITGHQFIKKISMYSSSPYRKI